MKLKSLISLLPVLGLVACSAPNKSKPVEETVEAEAPAKPKPMCGAYSEQRKPTEEEVAMFNGVMTEQGYTPNTVATQVVAGLNYRFYCTAPDGADCIVTIYKPLQGAPSLSSISK